MHDFSEWEGKNHPRWNAALLLSVVVCVSVSQKRFPEQRKTGTKKFKGKYDGEKMKLRIREKNFCDGLFSTHLLSLLLIFHLSVSLCFVGIIFMKSFPSQQFQLQHQIQSGNNKENQEHNRARGKMWTEFHNNINLIMHKFSELILGKDQSRYTGTTLGTPSVNFFNFNFQFG